MALELEGYQVLDASSAHQASTILEESSIDLVLLDWMMPGISGIDFAAKLRKQQTQRKETKKLAIIMLTAKSEENDVIRGFEVGADDYVKKPFSVRELISRIKAVLSRVQSDQYSGNNIQVGKIDIDIEKHQVLIDKTEVSFSPTEFRLLHFLASSPDRVYGRDQLLNNVWGEHVYVDDRTVDVHIRRLRKVLEPYGCDSYIRTIRGVGYRFSAN